MRPGSRGYIGGSLKPPESGVRMNTGEEFSSAAKELIFKTYINPIVEAVARDIVDIFDEPEGRVFLLSLSCHVENPPWVVSRGVEFGKTREEIGEFVP